MCAYPCSFFHLDSNFDIALLPIKFWLLSSKPAVSIQLPRALAPIPEYQHAPQPYAAKSHRPQSSIFTQTPHSGEAHQPRETPASTSSGGSSIQRQQRPGRGRTSTHNHAPNRGSHEKNVLEVRKNGGEGGRHGSARWFAGSLQCWERVKPFILKSDEANLILPNSESRSNRLACFDYPEVILNSCSI